MPPKRAKRLVVSPSQEERILNVNAFLQMFEDIKQKYVSLDLHTNFENYISTAYIQ